MKNLLFLFTIILLLSGCAVSPNDEITALNSVLKPLKEQNGGKLPVIISEYGDLKKYNHNE